MCHTVPAAFYNISASITVRPAVLSLFSHSLSAVTCLLYLHPRVLGWQQTSVSPDLTICTFPHITVALSCYSAYICYLEPVTPVSLLWPLSSVSASLDHCWLAFSTLWITVITDCSAPKSQEAVTFWNNTSGTDNHTTSKVTLTTRLCHSNI